MFFFVPGASYKTPCGLFKCWNSSERVINGVLQIGEVAAIYLHIPLQSQIKYRKEAAAVIFSLFAEKALARSAD